LAPSGILPRRRWCRCGASVVMAPGAFATERDPQMSLSKTSTKTKLARAKPAYLQEQRLRLARETEWRQNYAQCGVHPGNLG
jgi:hypothetical protein